MDREQLIIFLKAPRPGTVKTRLAGEIGSDAALAAYMTILVGLLQNLSRLPQVELRFTPDNAKLEIVGLLREGWVGRPQGPGGLGERLATAFNHAFKRGARRVVIIGSDCPFLAATDIQLAWTALKSHDLVLGPARDGGYWLIGLRRPCNRLFFRIPWSTGAVLHATLSRAQAANLKCKLLRRLSDVDTVADWNEFLASDDSPKSHHPAR